MGEDGDHEVDLSGTDGQHEIGQDEFGLDDGGRTFS